jgi:hypothetical protein
MIAAPGDGTTTRASAHRADNVVSRAYRTPRRSFGSGAVYAVPPANVTISCVRTIGGVEPRRRIKGR